MKEKQKIQSSEGVIILANEMPQIKTGILYRLINFKVTLKF